MYFMDNGTLICPPITSNYYWIPYQASLADQMLHYCVCLMSQVVSVVLLSLNYSQIRELSTITAGGGGHWHQMGREGCNIFWRI